ncbi:hypothetical protein [Streptomyces sp. NPDC001530]|uniref:hypothetical protein n=1 Tax=Streptomyces sp. NPDC001530 TaxID=3364582 RepID=UPI0036BA36AA
MQELLGRGQSQAQLQYRRDGDLALGSVSELNTRAYKLPGMRLSAPLSMDQLIDIVRSGSWRKAVDTHS